MISREVSDSTLRSRFITVPWQKSTITFGGLGLKCPHYTTKTVLRNLYSWPKTWQMSTSNCIKALPPTQRQNPNRRVYKWARQWTRVVSAITVVTQPCRGLLCFALWRPKSKKMKRSSELTSDKVYAVKTPRPSYRGKAVKATMLYYSQRKHSAFPVWNPRKVMTSTVIIMVFTNVREGDGVHTCSSVDYLL